jgi:hypothetical protein
MGKSGSSSAEKEWNYSGEKLKRTSWYLQERPPGGVYVLIIEGSTRRPKKTIFPYLVTGTIVS